MELKVISLFAGCGGSSLGYKLSGFKEILAVEYDKNATGVFKLNFPDVPVWEKDIKKIKVPDVLEFCNIKKGELDILDGSPPCQGFSTSGSREVNDERNDLFKDYIRFIRGLQPKVFIMENVPGMVKGKMKGRFLEILKSLKALDYNVKCKMLNSQYYNVPQSRQRLIFIGVRKDLKKDPKFPKPSNKIITVKKALSKIKPTDYLIPRSYMKWAKLLKPGQTISAIHPKGFGFNMRKLDLNKPAFVITKTHTPAVGLLHPSEHRFLAINELFILASFPKDFKYIQYESMPKTVRTIWARIGNSVPPLMMKAIAGTIKKEILEKR